jgi:hypothetical protein
MPAKIVAYCLLPAAAALVSSCGFESSPAVRHAISGPPAVMPVPAATMIPVEPASPREEEIVDLSLG